MFKKTLILSLVLVITAGCSVFKRKEKALHDKYRIEGSTKFLESVKEKNLTNEDFYIRKAEVQISMRSNKQNAILSVKYKKPDSALFIIRSWFGFEAARILITSDTVVMNDRLNKKLIVASPQYFKRRYGIEPFMIFTIFGDLLADLRKMQKDVNCVDNFFETDFYEGKDYYKYIIDCELRKVTNAVIENMKFKHRVEFAFSDFVKEKKQSMPLTSSIKIESENIEVVIKIDKIDMEGAVNIDFIPGRGYERKVLK